MTERNEYLAILESCGADERRWPAEKRARMWRMIETDPDLRAAFEDAQALDTLLDKARIGPVNNALARRLIDSAPRPSPLSRFGEWCFSSFWHLAGGAVGMLAFGLLAGTALGPIFAVPDDGAAVQDYALLAVGDGDYLADPVLGGGGQ